MPGLGTLLYAVLALALVLSGVHADPRVWGLHAYAFLPRSAWLAAALGLAVFIVPAVAARAGALAARVGALLSRSLLFPVAVALVAAPCFGALRGTSHENDSGGHWAD